MKTILITGAAGDVGTHLRRELAGKYVLRVSDLRPLRKINKEEQFVRADISRMSDALKITRGVDAIVHLGGYSVEGPWAGILQANIVGLNNNDVLLRSDVADDLLVSSVKSADAFKAVEHLGIQEREAFKLSLRATLVKDERFFDRDVAPAFESKGQVGKKDMVDVRAQRDGHEGQQDGHPDGRADESPRQSRPPLDGRTGAAAGNVAHGRTTGAHIDLPRASKMPRPRKASTAKKTR